MAAIVAWVAEPVTVVASVEDTVELVVTPDVDGLDDDFEEVVALVLDGLVLLAFVAAPPEPPVPPPPEHPKGPRLELRANVTTSETDDEALRVMVLSPKKDTRRSPRTSS